MKYNGYQTFISWIWCSFWKVVNISLGKHLVCGNLELLTNPENDWLPYRDSVNWEYEERVQKAPLRSTLSLSVTACLTSTNLIPLIFLSFDIICVNLICLRSNYRNIQYKILYRENGNPKIAYVLQFAILIIEVMGFTF